MSNSNFYGANPLTTVKNIVIRKNERLLKNAAIQDANKLFELFNKKYKTDDILRC